MIASHGSEQACRRLAQNPSVGSKQLGDPVRFLFTEQLPRCLEASITGSLNRSIKGLETCQVVDIHLKKDLSDRYNSRLRHGLTAY